jgi:ABC-type antimicrobial peptide transport system permease subunit
MLANHPTLQLVWTNVTKRGLVTTLLYGALVFFMGMSAGMLSLNQELIDGPQRYMRSLDNVDYWMTARDSVSLSSSSYIPEPVQDLLTENGYHYEGTLVYWSFVDGHPVTYQSYKPGGILEPELHSGRQINGDNEVVFDRVLANSLDVEIGDSITLRNTEFLVVGLSTNTNAMVREIVFMSHTAMATINGEDLVQVVAIDLQPNQALPSVYAPNDIYVGTDVPADHPASFQLLTHDEFIEENLWSQIGSISPFFAIILVVLWVGSVFSLVAMVYLAVSLKKKELALYRLFTTGSYLRRVEFASILTQVVISAPFAFGLAWLIANAAEFGVPGITPRVSLTLMAIAFGVTMVLTLLAVSLPLRRIKRLSPMELVRAS